MYKYSVPSSKDSHKTPAIIEELLHRINTSGLSIKKNNDRLKISSQNGDIEPDLLADIKENKSALLHYMDTQSLERVYPASFAQQRLWLADKLSENNSFQLSELLFLQGDLDINALQETFNIMMERHDILRTNFFEKEGQLYQKVVDDTNFTVHQINVAEADDGDALKVVNTLVNKAMQQPFDLAIDNLIRVNVYCGRGGCYWLFITIHHIISDGWSVGILTREMVEIYESICNERAPLLDSLPLQYADFSVWQQEQMKAGKFDQQLRYWTDKLQDCPSLAFPMDFHRPTRQSHRGDSLHVEIEPDLFSLIKAYCRRESVSPFMVLLSAFYVLMQRYAQQDDIVVGTSIANRHHEQLEPLLGLFVNIFALRQNLSGNPGFKQLVTDVKCNLLDAYDNQDVPFEKVVEAMGKKYDASRSPLFQVAFTVENTPSERLYLGDLQVDAIPLENTTAKYDLTFHVQEADDKFSLEIEYCTDLLTAASVDTLSNCYLHILSDVMMKPEKNINDIRLLSTVDENALFALLKGPETELPTKNLVELFEQQVVASPDMPALTAPDHAPIELWPSISEFYVYDDLIYYAMTSDEKRNQCYRAALATLAPGKTVLEIGTGPDVILSRFAIEAGASHVYAVELLKETYDKAKETIARLNLQDKITLIHGDATTVELPEKVDIILSEIVGAIGGSEGCAVIQNQTRKHLKPGGQVIPNRSHTTITPIGLPDRFFDTPGFSPTALPYIDKIFEEIGHPFDLRLCVKNMGYHDVVANVETFEDLVFSDVVDEESEHSVHFVFEQDAHIDGFLLWLNLETIHGEWIDTLAHEHCWLPVYVPAFDQKQVVNAGDQIDARITRSLADNEINPTFSITGKLIREQNKNLTFDVSMDHFNQQFCASAMYKKLFANGKAVPQPELYSTLTYAELNDRVNRHAHYLQHQHIGAGDVVAVCLKKSWQSVVAILAILKTGAAYLPIDPAYPKQRIEYIAQNAEISMLISDKTLYSLWQDMTIPVIDLFAASADIAQCSADNLHANISMHDPAYVIYTSGSTGQPKGVVIEHISAINLQQAQTRQFAVEPSSRVLQFAPQAFDAAASEWLMALLSGATLVVPSDGITQDVERLGSFIQQQQIDVATLPPVVLNVLDPQRVTNLTTLISAGEPCTQRICQQWAKGRRLFNAYGPTENSVCSTIYPCQTDEPGDPAIGKIIDNQQAYVLDAFQNPLPIGVPGELYMAGIGLAREYRNNPALTAKAFVKPAWSKQRLYRTGDLVRVGQDGNVHYIGRRDSQVKIRGFRIELGEIESHLRDIAVVQDALCLVREDAQGQSRQVYAFVIANRPSTEQALFSHLESSLPSYLLPARIVVLEHYPVTANGKVDRSALLESINKIQSDSTQRMVQPRSEKESLFSGWFSDILGVEDVSITDSFFELGGDSILAVQLVAKCREAGFTLRVTDVFEYRTPAMLAQLDLTQDVVAQTQQGLLSGDVLLTPIQQWFFEQQYAQPHHWNQSVLLTLDKRVSVASLSSAMNSLLLQHDALRLQLSPAKDAHVLHQYYQQHVDCQVEVVDLRHIQSTAVLAQAIEENAQVHQAGFDLMDGQLCKVVLFETHDSMPENRLAFIAHHLVIDIYSWRIVLEDLQQLLVSSLSATPSPLSKKTSSFQFYANALKEYANSARCQMHVPYWQAVVDRVDSLSLPMRTDAETDSTVKNISVAFAAETSQYLESQALTAFTIQAQDLLFSALRLAVSQAWEHQDLCVMMESHGRQEFDEQVDSSRTVGWFTSLFPVVFPRHEQEKYAELILQTKEIIRAVPERGLGYGAMRYLHSNPNIRRSLTPVQDPQIVVNYVGRMEEQTQEDAIIGIASGSVGRNIGSENLPAQALAVTAMFNDDIFELSFDFNNAFFSDQQIQNVADACRHQLTALVDFCRHQQRRYHSPSDFSLVTLTKPEINVLEERYPEVMDVWPLTKSQQGMFLGTLASEGKAYVEQMVLEIEATMDESKLNHAWHEVQRANPLLTSRIHSIEDTPYFVIQRDSSTDIGYQNWINKTENKKTADAIKAYAKSIRDQGIHLSTEAGCDLQLIQLDDHRVVVLLTVSHVLMDGWSHANLMTQLLQVYRQEAVYSPPFSGYLRWLQKQDVDASAGYWKNVQTGCHASYLCEPEYVEQLPAEANIHARQLTLSREQYQKIDALAREQGVLLNATLQALWGVLLSRYTESERVVFGYTTSGRPESLAGVEQMIGFFINTLPMVVDINVEDIWQLSAAVQQRTVSSSAHQYFSAAEIMNVSGHQQPLYDSLVVFENYSTTDVNSMVDDMGFDQIINHDTGGGETTSALTLLIKPEHTLTIDMVFDENKIDAGHVMNVLNDYHSMIMAIAEGEYSIAALQERLVNAQKPICKMRKARVNTSVLDATEQSISDIYSQVTGQQTPDIDANFFDLGGHSLLALQLLQSLNNTIDTQVSVADLFTASSIRSLAALIKERTLNSHRHQTTEGHTLIPLSSTMQGMPIFFVAGVGGSCISFYALVNALHDSFCAYGLQPPRLSGAREIELHSVSDYARHYIHALTSAQPEGPYRLVGHSFGSFIVYEMARQLEKEGQQVSIVILDTPAPLPGRVLRSTLSEDALRHQALTIVAQFTGEESITLLSDTEFSLLSTDEKKKHIDALCHHSAMPFTSEVLSDFMEEYVNQSRLAYTPDNSLQNTWTMLLHARNTQEFVRQHDEDELGWAEFIQAPLLVKVVDGDHLSMLHHPHAETVASYLTEAFQHLSTGSSSDE